MKTQYTRLAIPKLILILCGAVATTAVFGQSTIQWIGGVAGGGINSSNLGVSTNWASSSNPTNNSPVSTDVLQFAGLTSGNVVAYSIDGINHAGSGTAIGGNGGAQGCTLEVTAAQTSPVNVSTLGFTGVGTPGSQMGLDNIIIDAGGGQFSIGDTTDNQLYAVFRPSGGTHVLMNNSANTAWIYPNMQCGSGGGSPSHVFDFEGTGNWVVTNSLRWNNNSGGAEIEFGGGTGPINDATNDFVPFSGTVTWYPGGADDLINSGTGAVNVNSGELIIAGPGLLEANGNLNILLAGGVLDFNAPGQSDSIVRYILCQTAANPPTSGTLQVDNGTWTFSGANTYSNTVLNGGEFIVNGAENPGASGPIGEGTIYLNGGTLGFSVNSQYDYSSRFSTAAGQQYNIDTGAYNVTLATALASSGATLTKFGGGALTLTGANTYSGGTTVSAGNLVYQGMLSGTGNITVDNSATLTVVENGSQLTPATLTLGTTASANLAFNNVTNTSTAPIAAGAVSVGGPIAISVNSGVFVLNDIFPLLSFSGSAPAVTLVSLTGAGGALSTNNGTIELTITALAVVWTGLGNGDWDTTSPDNWQTGGTAEIFANGGPVLFDDTATGTTSVTVNAEVLPKSIAVNSSSNVYSINSGGSDYIGGTASLTKSGTTTLTLSGGVNAFTGATTISGGILSVGALTNGGSPSDIGAAPNSAANLVLNGGTLQYTGNGAASDRLFTLGTAGGTIDDEGYGLTLSNTGAIAFSGTGARTLTLTGSDSSGDMLSAVIGNNGGSTAVTKAGAGTWILTGNNTYSGATTIEGGTLQVGNGTTGTLGTGNITDDAALVYDVSNTLTVTSVVSGTGSLTQMGSGTLILDANDTYSGGTTITNGVLELGIGGATGSLANENIVDNGTFIYNSTSTLSTTAAITGTGNVIVNAGLLEYVGANSYTGWTQINPGAIFEPCNGQNGALASSVVTNNGTLELVRQDGAAAAPVFDYAGNIVGSGSVVKENNNQNPGYAGLSGTNNTYTGGTLIRGGGLILGDGATAGSGSIVGTVTFANTLSGNLNFRNLNFFFPTTTVFTNPIIGAVTDGSTVANSGAVEQSGAGKVVITANNSYPAGTTIDANTTLQVGIGGTTGSLGTGAVTDNGELIFNLSDNLTFNNGISGPGGVVQAGSGVLTLIDTDTNTGPTAVINGTLVDSLTGGDLDLGGGILVPGSSLGSVGTLTVDGSMNITNGEILIAVDGNSSSTISVSGSITCIGSGTLKLLNYGPGTPAAETVFNIFSGPVTGRALTVLSPGLTLQNNLATAGTVKVLSAETAGSDVIAASISNGQLKLTWPAAFIGLHLEGQTNSTGITANWVVIPGTDGVNSYSIPVGTNECAFYRLAP